MYAFLSDVDPRLQIAWGTPHLQVVDVKSYKQTPMSGSAVEPFVVE